MTDKMLKNWFGIAFGFFLFIALEGLLIRYLPFQSYIENENYYNILQSHSHTSFLGWVLPALLIFLIFDFNISIFKDKAGTNIYFTLFYLIVFVSGISFIISGYGIISIISLVLFMLICYYGLYKLFIGINSGIINKDCQICNIYIKTAIVLFFVSSISTWILPVFIISGLKKTPVYFYSIYFYLHFLFNGFMSFVILAIYLRNIAKKWAKRDQGVVIKSFLSLLAGTILTYSGSLLWNKVPVVFNFLNFVGALMLLVPLIFFSGFIKEYLKKASLAEKSLFFVAWTSLLIKVLMQLSQSFPYLAEASYIMKGQFIVGYMHLVTLGFISSFIISYAFRIGLLRNSGTNIFASYLYIISLLLIELTLISHGILMMLGIYILSPYFNILMLIFTLPLILSIVLFSFNFFNDLVKIIAKGA